MPRPEVGVTAMRIRLTPSACSVRADSASRVHPNPSTLRIAATHSVAMTSHVRCSVTLGCDADIDAFDYDVERSDRPAQLTQSVSQLPPHRILRRSRNLFKGHCAGLVFVRSPWP